MGKWGGRRVVGGRWFGGLVSGGGREGKWGGWW